MMISTMLSYLNRKISCKKVKVEPLRGTKVVYRDELTTKKQTPKKAVKKCVRFSDSEPTILGEDNEKRSCADNNNNNNNNEEVGKEEVIRVRVKMTKEEAIRLLSKCNGGVLEFKDVATELGSIPVNRVSFVTTCTPSHKNLDR